LVGWCAALILPTGKGFWTRGAGSALFVHARNMPPGAAGCERRLGARDFKLDHYPAQRERAALAWLCYG
jgi:hypothetical protein